MKTKKVWIAMIVLVVCICAVWAAEKETDSQTSQTSQTPQLVFDRKDFLKDLKYFIVKIDDLKPELEKYGLTEEKLRTDVELRLRQSRIEIISKVSDVKDLAMLVLSIHTLMLEETQQIGYATCITGEAYPDGDYEIDEAI